MNTVEEAIIAKLTWKTDVTQRYARAFLETGVSLFIRGTNFFNNDDVAERDQPNDGTTVGVVVKMLLMAKVIEATYPHLPDKGIIYGRRASTRDACNGHKNQLYRFTNANIALEWLRRNGRPSNPIQTELFDMPATATNAVASGL